MKIFKPFHVEASKLTAKLNLNQISTTVDNFYLLPFWQIYLQVLRQEKLFCGAASAMYKYTAFYYDDLCNEIYCVLPWRGRKTRRKRLSTESRGSFINMTKLLLLSFSYLSWSFNFSSYINDLFNIAASNFFSFILLSLFRRFARGRKSSEQLGNIIYLI